MTDAQDEKPWLFQPGNRFWEAKSSYGRKPHFESPEQLWEASVEYFKWVHDNPLYEDTLVSFQGKSKHEAVAKMRAMTISGLCIFLDISQRSWSDYRAKNAFSPVVSAIEDVIKTQKFEGASAGFLNANIIARDLGLADKSELTGKDGGPVQFANLSDEELERRIAERLGKA